MTQSAETALIGPGMPSPPGIPVHMMTQRQGLSGREPQIWEL
jgi:hypothetical protein